MLEKNLKINKVIRVILLIITFIFCKTSNVYASIAKWDAYPEWGLLLKISLISLWISIPITILGIIAKFVLSKLNRKSNITNKVINTIILIFFCLSLVSKIIVEINIYNNPIMYLIIGMAICMFLILLTRNIRILSSNAFYIIILCILIILLITNDNIYPYEYTGYTDVLLVE